MATRASGKYRAWIRPFRHWWKPLAWIWGALILGVVVNDGSSWLITKSFDVSGTPLGWVVGHLGITLPLVGALIFFTCLAGLAHHQAEALTTQVVPQLALTPQQRLRFIRSFQQEYGSRLVHSLQGRVALELGLHERTDMIASSAELVFHHTDTATEYPLPSGTSIIQVYDQAQRGLLILGVPGSGKSTLLLHLAIELLQRAESDPDHPIPIILNLSSWAEKKLPLTSWFCEQCAFIYGIPKRISASWIASDQILFLLDGLDEVEASARSACLDAINICRGEHLNALIVCSRSQEYENLQTRLILPAAVEIQPLEVVQTAAYLKQAGKSLATVRTALRANTTLQQLVTTPLMLTIMLLTYRDKAVKDLPLMGSPEDQQRQIFTHYVERMLERRATKSDFTSQQTRQWLIWLAKQMQQRHLTEFYLERLQPTWLPTKWSQALYCTLSGLIFGLLFGLPIGLLGGLVFTLLGGLLVGLLGGLVLALFLALLGGLIIGRVVLCQEIRPQEILTWSWKGTWRGLVFGLLVGLTLAPVLMLVFGLLGRLSGGLLDGLVFGLSCELVFGALGGLLGGLSSKQINEDVRIKPNQGIRHSGWNALRIMLFVMLASGLFFGLLGWLADSLLAVLISGPLVGLVIGLYIGLLGRGWEGKLHGAGGVYLQHYLLRYVLCRSGVMPWHYVLFLEEAHERILLQRVGGGYRFIHPLLQEYFASLATSSVAS